MMVDQIHVLFRMHLLIYPHTCSSWKSFSPSFFSPLCYLCTPNPQLGPTWSLPLEALIQVTSRVGGKGASPEVKKRQQAAAAASAAAASKRRDEEYYEEVFEDEEEEEEDDGGLEFSKVIRLFLFLWWETECWSMRIFFFPGKKYT